MLASAVLKPSSSPARTRSAERGRGVGEGGKGKEEGASGRSRLIHLDSGCLLRGDKSLLLPFLRGMQRDWPCGAAGGEKPFTVRSAMAGGEGRRGRYCRWVKWWICEELSSRCDFTSNMQLFINCWTKQEEETSGESSAVCRRAVWTSGLKEQFRHLGKIRSFSFLSEWHVQLDRMLNSGWGV